MFSIVDNSTHLHNICRICLNEASKHTFSENIDTEIILNKINECFQITLHLENYLPFIICQECVDDLTKAESFRIKCITITKRLKHYCESLLNSPSKTSEDNIEVDGNFDIVNQPNFESVNWESFNTGTISKQSSYKCDKCNKILKSMKSLTKHVVSMHDKRRHIGKVSGFGATRLYHCTTCFYSTPHSQTLVNHMRRHNGERPFTCECGKSFTQASSLTAHRKIHSNTTYFTCSQCGKQFKHAFSLKTHLRVHKEGNFICNICTKVLKSKETLCAHIRRHYKTYNFNCEECGDTFITSAELHNHKLKHTTEKKVQCHICEYSTNTKKSLVVHLKRHVGDKAFKCAFCVKSCYTQGDLRRHMRVHTREKPYACQTCAQRFSYSTSLNKHMQTVHNVQFKWGDVKWKETKTKKILIKNPLND